MKNNILKRYKEEKDGNVSLMFAVSFTMTSILIGAAFDLILMQKSQEKLQNLSDAAALAALKHEGDTNQKEAAFNDYVNTLSGISGDENNIVTTQVNIVETETTISLHANVDMPFELMMLNRFHDFDTISASSQVEMGIENIEIALVIDISSSMNGARLTEAKNSAAFFIDQVMGDESLNGRVAISFVPFGGTVRVPEQMSNLLQTPQGGFKAFSKQWINGEWNQCFEFDTEEIIDGINLNGSYKVSPDFWSWHSSNPWCPTAGNEFLPLTDDVDALNAKIDMLTLSDGTGSDHGMLWGYETLNAEWKNKFPGGLVDTPAKNKSKTKKILVFMTDGGITSQHYVRDEFKEGLPPYNSKRKVRVSYGQSLKTFYSLCDKAKSKDIEIYTIGYNITKVKHEKPLRSCASSETHYLDALTGNLEDVFGDIAATISPLRLSN